MPLLPAFACKKTVHPASRTELAADKHSKSPLTTLLPLCLFALVSGATAAEPDIDWKTLPEYMAMDRDAQLELILNTRRIVMRKIAETDFPRAECIGGLFAVTEEGNKQFYNLKGFLKDAADEGLFPGWKAQQVAAYVMKTHLCPVKSPASLSSK